MKLLRLGCLHFSELPEEWEKWRGTIGGIEIGTIGSNRTEKGVRLIVIAQAEMKYFPKVTAQGLAVIPEKLRKQLEGCIETMGNLISLSIRGRRTISSPTPSIALLPENDEERTRLAQVHGFSFLPGNRCETGSLIKFSDIGEYLEHLQDRLDGVALLVESIAHEHLTGKFHEYIRVFERAFRLSSKRLIAPLADFLCTSAFQYSAQEVENWILNIRHPITHADERECFLLESDVRPVIRRVEQAAYDVLFNKEMWRNPQSNRRDVWQPPFGTNSTNGDIFITQGFEVNLENQILDEFQAYPLDLQGIMKNIPIEWLAFPPSEIRASGQVTVKPKPFSEAESSITDPIERDPNQAEAPA
ncbi:MAG: hypothetical protein HXX11_18300 [Desulfuromonadales bacterium]|nr:hypothetical protein [Desulfuromonadales bacterium]